MISFILICTELKRVRADSYAHAIVLQCVSVKKVQRVSVAIPCVDNTTGVKFVNTQVKDED